MMTAITPARFRPSNLPAIITGNKGPRKNSHEEPEKHDRKKASSLTNPLTILTAVRKFRKSASVPAGLVTQLGKFSTRHLPDSEEDPVTKRKNLFRKFKRAAKLAAFCARQAKEHSLRNRKDDIIGPYISGLHFHEYETSSLLFDPTRYKADKQLRISEDARRILQKLPEDRTRKELAYVQVALRNIRSIAEYPVRMQQKIAEVGQYEKYEAKRVIVRQGHPASAFYFILSGSVVVMVADGRIGAARPVAYLHKGMAFGELAIINRTTRQSTIIAKETIELLSIDIKDFHNIFMAGGTKNTNDPDHEAFLRNLDYLRGWPLEKMAENSSKCIFHFFKSGEVLVKDSNYSNWIYIVKSGSLKILKKLKRVGPYESKCKRKIDPVVKTDRQKKEERDLREKQRRYILPELNIPLRVPDDDVSDKLDVSRLELPEINHVAQANLTKGADTHAKTKRRTKHARHKKDATDSTDEATYDASDNTFVSRLPREQSEVRPLSGNVQTRSRHPVKHRGHHSAVDPVYDSGTEEEESVQLDITDLSPDNSPRKDTNRDSNGASISKHRLRKKKSRKDEEDEEIQQEMNGFKQEIRTITKDLDNGFRYKDLSDLSPADRDPQFVHIQTLTKGQAFGISETILGRQPSLCVVSAGAECIMLDKNFYLDHAPDMLIRRMRQECCPYPTDDELQDSLQVSVDWDAFRASTFRQTLKRLQTKKELPVWMN